MNVTEHTYNTLRHRLIANHYDPGVQLKEEAVARDLGISRTPVRAAFARLISEGLLAPGEKRGAIVTQWRKENASEIFALRILLEGFGAHLCARNATEEHLRAIEEACNRTEVAFQQKPRGWRDILDRGNRIIHTTIIEGSGSSHLRLSARHLLDIPMIIGGFYFYSEDDIADSLRHHRELLRALMSRNGEWARAVVECHLNAALERFLRQAESAHSG